MKRQHDEVAEAKGAAPTPRKIPRRQSKALLKISHLEQEAEVELYDLTEAPYDLMFWKQSSEAAELLITDPMGVFMSMWQELAPKLTEANEGVDILTEKSLAINSKEHGYAHPWDTEAAIHALHDEISGKKYIATVALPVLAMFAVKQGEAPDGGKCIEHAMSCFESPKDVIKILSGRVVGTDLLRSEVIETVWSVDQIRFLDRPPPSSIDLIGCRVNVFGLIAGMWMWERRCPGRLKEWLPTVKSVLLCCYNMPVNNPEVCAMEFREEKGLHTRAKTDALHVLEKSSILARAEACMTGQCGGQKPSIPKTVQWMKTIFGEQTDVGTKFASDKVVSLLMP